MKKKLILSDLEKIAIGEQFIDILKLKPVKGFNPKRYDTIWGNKTALGVYEVCKYIINGGF